MEYIFETEHLKIRKFRPEDAEPLFAICREEGVKKWFPNECFADLEEAEDAVAFYMDRAAGHRLPFVLAVELKETAELIGNTGINETEACADDIEIGYIISSRHSGRGYATELLGAMSAYVASAFGLGAIYGRVIHGNLASTRVLEKCGYSFMGEEFGAEDDPYGKGMLVYKKDTVM